MEIRGVVKDFSEKSGKNGVFYSIQVENDTDKITGSIFNKKPAIKVGDEVIASYEVKGQYKNWLEFKIAPPQEPKSGGSNYGYKETKEDYNIRQRILTRQGALANAMIMFGRIDDNTNRNEYLAGVFETADEIVAWLREECPIERDEPEVVL